MKPEELRPGVLVKGPGDPTQVAKIVLVEPLGPSVIKVYYEQGTDPKRTTITAEELEHWEHVNIETLPGGDPKSFLLAMEALRIAKAHTFDDRSALSAVHGVEPLPHQITAVYHHMLPMKPIRFLLADDPGAGKTIMAGLLLRELMLRGDVERVLVVCPGSLVNQWMQEMDTKFRLLFTPGDAYQTYAAGDRNWFREHNLIVASIDQLKRDDERHTKLREAEWDIVIVDEAHKMSCPVGLDGAAEPSLRYQLGQMLGDRTRHFVLMTATPHNGKEEDFRAFMALIDPDRFHGRLEGAGIRIKSSDCIRRLIKEQMRRFDGTRLFPPRDAQTLGFRLAPEAQELYERVTAYVRTEYNRAKKIADPQLRQAIGFALAILQRRLASSPAAIAKSLERRAQRLRDQLREASEPVRFPPKLFDREIDESDLTEEEQEARDDALMAVTTHTLDPAEIRAEIELVEELARLANDVKRLPHGDAKWAKVIEAFDNPVMRGADGHRRKVVVFTEFRDTLAYLVERFQKWIGDDEAVVAIQGGMDRATRLRVEQAFKQDPKVRVLVATDAAGEGINLQVTNQMINYDLPWNPNRMEQRFGRIHRIGQRETCYLWNLVAVGTREGDVYKCVLEKLNEIRHELDDSVFDIVGELLEGVSLADAMVEAVRNPGTPLERVEALEKLLGSVDIENARRIKSERSLVLVDDPFDVGEVYKEFQRVQARRLQPYLLEDFFLRAMRAFRGGLERREPGRYQVTTLPPAVRNTARDLRIGPILERYQRVCFDKDRAKLDGALEADVLDVSHPLMRTVVQHTLNTHGAVLRLGSILIDPENRTAHPRVLVVTRSDVRGWDAAGVQRTLQEAILFHEVGPDLVVRDAGPAPHLELHPASEAQMKKAGEYVDAKLVGMAQGRVIEHVAGDAAEKAFQSYKTRHVARIQRVREQVQQGLSAEIMRLDALAYKYDQEARSGKKTKLTADGLRARRDRLRQQMDQRLRSLDREERLERGGPEIVALAVILPQILLEEGIEVAMTTLDGRRRIQRAALDAVLEVERRLGNAPRDVEELKLGYDIESASPDQKLRFIEVKGRRKGSDTVTITKNEILTMLNEPEKGILAIVEVDGEQRDITYVHHPVNRMLSDDEISSNFNLQKLKAKGYDPLTTQPSTT